MGSLRASELAAIAEAVTQRREVAGEEREAERLAREKDAQIDFLLEIDRELRLEVDGISGKLQRAAENGQRALKLGKKLRMFRGSPPSSEQIKALRAIQQVQEFCNAGGFDLEILISWDRQTHTSHRASNIFGGIDMNWGGGGIATDLIVSLKISF